MHVFHVSVRPSDLDSFGHVNNARYMDYLEWARADWLIQRGFSYQRFLDIGLVPAVIDARLRYQREVAFGETLEIRTHLEVRHPARIEFHHEVLRSDGVRAMRARISVVAVDATSRTLTTFPDALLSTAVPTEEDGRDVDADTDS